MKDGEKMLTIEKAMVGDVITEALKTENKSQKGD